MIALNKVDRLKPAAILEAIAAVSGLDATTSRCIPISARTGDGVARARGRARGAAARGAGVLRAGVDSDQPLERRIGELVREQALARTREEVPHAIAVVVDEVKAAARRSTPGASRRR